MKCFYHNDMDGRCAGSIVACVEDDYRDDNYLEVDYSMDFTPMLNQIKNGEKVYFVDYSFTEKTKDILLELIKKKCDVIWIDHHISSLKLVEKYSEFNKIKGIRKNGISGAALTFMYFNECDLSKVPHYIQLISDYDCWHNKYYPYSTYFKLGIDSVYNNALDQIWIDLYNQYYDEKYYPHISSGRYLDNIIQKGEQIKQYIDFEMEDYREQYSYESEIAGYKVLVVNRKTNSWIFGDKIKEYPLVMVWAFNGTKYTYSIFSENEDIDCSKIAESYGGGGHKGAAGFSSDKLLFVKK